MLAERSYHILRTMTYLRTDQTLLVWWRINYNLFWPRYEIDGKTPKHAACLDAPFSHWVGVFCMAESIVTDKTHALGPPRTGVAGVNRANVPLPEWS